MIKRVFCVTAGLGDLDGEDSTEINKHLQKYMHGISDNTWDNSESSDNYATEDEDDEEKDLNESDLEQEVQSDDSQDSAENRSSKRVEKRSTKKAATKNSNSFDANATPAHQDALATIECEVETKKTRGVSHCEACGDKIFLNKEDYDKHLKSRGHAKRVEKLAEAQKQFESGTLGLKTADTEVSKPRNNESKHPEKLPKKSETLPKKSKRKRKKL
eukprot:Selendium_serpulae@DN4006_c0_g1_i4.p1